MPLPAENGGTTSVLYPMAGAVRMLVYIMNHFFVSLVTTIEFELQQHTRERGEFQAHEYTMDGLIWEYKLGGLLCDLTNTSIDYQL